MSHLLCELKVCNTAAVIYVDVRSLYVLHALTPLRKYNSNNKQI